MRFDQLGLDPKADYAAFEFWEEKFLGVVKGGVEVSLAPESSRISRSQTHRRAATHRHGHTSASRLSRVEATQVGRAECLSGRYHRARVQREGFHLRARRLFSQVRLPTLPTSARLTHVEDRLWMQEIEFRERA